MWWVGGAYLTGLWRGLLARERPIRRRGFPEEDDDDEPVEELGDAADLEEGDPTGLKGA